ncbi:MAG: exo-poly-alpha-D-galacturonosidase [Terriglobia bacterium]|nr:MAG: exo-poly-alpha-D-galacturonosidase [Terriglobia bacterium]
MSIEHMLRRSFVTGTGAGLAATALGAQTAQAPGHGSSPAPGEFYVTAFGARGDGKTLDTAAVNRAIEAASAAGGGAVTFPSGTYLCYSIHLKSKVTLYLARGATILAANPPGAGTAGGYDDAEPNAWDKFQDYGHSHWRNSLIWGEGLNDIGIEGPGLIWGKGLSRGSSSDPGPKAEDPRVGNKAISLKNCRNVTFRDFSILQGGHFGILATGVDNFTIDNLKIDTNRDGIDIDCCRNVRISNCSVNSPWDDAICLKSSFGLGYARATDMVTITNCLVSGSFAMGSLLDGTFQPLPAGVSIPRTGRIKFGTESNGGFKNITVSNCVFDGCQGLALESVDGAILEDVTVTNITMRDISSSPLFLRLGRRMRGPEGVPVGVLRRVLISNISCSNSASRYGSIISGIPGHLIENIKIRDVYIQHQGGGTAEAAAIRPPEEETGYPDPHRFGDIPAQFFIRHTRNLEISNIEFEVLKPDLRPVFLLTDVQDASLFRIKAPRISERGAFALRDVRNFNITASKPLIGDTQIDRAEDSNL